MKRLLLTLCVAAVTSAFAERQGPWTRERAWEWHNAQPWLRGANYMPASAANRVDQWQSYGAEARFAEMEREMALAEDCGFNAMRLLVLEQGFCVWLEEHDAFMANFERTLSIMAKHGVRAVVVFGNDCSRPESAWSRPTLGEQRFDVGYHGGRRLTQHGSFSGAGYLMVDDERYRVRFFEMCRELISKYARDDRVAIWNLWNEPGAGNRGDRSASLIRGLFELAWKIDPVQPLCADTWSRSLGNIAEGRDPEPIEKLAIELSDIVSYHGYCSLDVQVKVADNLAKKYGRPLYNTEWLLRGHGCEFADNYAFLAQRKIGSFNWGFVNGKYQTHEPYEPLWKGQYEFSGGDPTRWFHDLFRPSLHPWDPYEIAVARNVNREADADAKGTSLRRRIAASHRIIREGMWYGFRRIDFDFNGHEATVVEPSIAPEKGMPWTWTIQWWDAFVDRTGVDRLLKAGWHHVWIDGFRHRADAEGIKLFGDFQEFLVRDLGFAPKTCLVGMSWGGFFSTRYAAAYPQNVAKIYLDAPLLNLDALDGLAGTPTEDAKRVGPWAAARPAEGWFTSPEMPVNMAEKLAAAKIKILLLYGGQDQTVNPKTSCEPFAERFKAAGGDIQIDRRWGFGHHPHGVDPDKTSVITDFFRR